jgi:hypothetical protein
LAHSTGRLTVSISLVVISVLLEGSGKGYDGLEGSYSPLVLGRRDSVAAVLSPGRGARISQVYL